MLQIFENQFTHRDCQRMIDYAEPELEKAGLLGDQRDGYRIAEGTWLPHDLVLSTKVCHRVAGFARCEMAQMELIHIVKYGIGGEYKPHHDFFHITEDYAAEHLTRGGNRTKTALIYLNDNFTGGETYFPELQKTITPQRGKLVIWENMTADGKLNYQSIHAGLPVNSGTKYIAVIFIREQRYGNTV